MRLWKRRDGATVAYGLSLKAGQDSHSLRTWEFARNRDTTGCRKAHQRVGPAFRYRSAAGRCRADRHGARRALASGWLHAAFRQRRHHHHAAESPEAGSVRSRARLLAGRADDRYSVRADRSSFGGGENRAGTRAARQGAAGQTRVFVGRKRERSTARDGALHEPDGDPPGPRSVQRRASGGDGCRLGPDTGGACRCTHRRLACEAGAAACAGHCLRQAACASSGHADTGGAGNTVELRDVGRVIRAGGHVGRDRPAAESRDARRTQFRGRPGKNGRVRLRDLRHFGGAVFGPRQG